MSRLLNKNAGSFPNGSRRLHHQAPSDPAAQLGYMADKAYHPLLLADALKGIHHIIKQASVQCTKALVQEEELQRALSF